jgi:hypothetical protein
MIMRHQLHLRESRGTTTLMMIHQPGAAIRAGIDLHLGQKPKLGGRYADNSLIYTSYFVGSLYIHVSLSFTLLLLAFISAFQNTKDQKYFRCFSLFVSLVCYLWFALLAIFSLLFENPKIFCFVCYSFCFCFKNRKPQKYLLLFSVL